MGNSTEKVIEMTKVIDDSDNHKFWSIIYEIISMIFEIAISFVPIFLYCLVFFLANTEVDYYEHIKNGSIVWTFLALLIAGNFKLLINKRAKNGLICRLISGTIIFFILILLGVYLILNFSTYGFIAISLNATNTTIIVWLLGISTIVLNVLRIVFFSE